MDSHYVALHASCIITCIMDIQHVTFTFFPPPTLQELFDRFYDIPITDSKLIEPNPLVEKNINNLPTTIETKNLCKVSPGAASGGSCDRADM